ncbi:molybdopterin converting factor subunit 1 [Thiofilum flexile]|uniref:molybdopterin converting factor subunit 1 n=1 Tax=Thiofilum flexile TaxID=125627 RepID=UPI0003725711|nr:molybdopterin converting factor subunit 1 [Thiofilum flexile]
MSIKVLFFGSLKEQINKAQVLVDYVEPLTAAQLWQQVTGKEAIPNTVRVAVNQSYSDASTILHEGDEVAFFPPVTGG